MRIVILLIALGITANASAQQKWNLRSVVDYAMANNITVKITDIQAQNAALTYKQSKYSQFPSLALSANGGVNNGRSQSNTDFSLITNTNFQAGAQLQSSVDIFNFYSKRNSIAANKWELEAAKANVDKTKNDIALTAANAYLQVLLALEQQKITEIQIQQTQAQLTNTLKLVKAGSLPELNATQLEAQLALDSVNYITAKGTAVQNVLDLKNYMSIDAAADFEVEAPPVESIPLDPISELLPENVYAMALVNQPLQKYNALKINAADKFAAAAKGQMYPTLSAYGNVSSGYNNRTPQLLGFSTVTVTPQQIGTVIVGGTPLVVNSPSTSIDPVFGKRSFVNQASDNFSQGIGLSLSVPIFNGRTLRTNYEKSLLNIKSLEFQKQLDDQKLKQDIYSAYNSVLIALEKFNASSKSVALNQKTFDFAQKRFNVGMLGTFDLITTQNNLLRSKLEYTLNQFDYVFKMKVLEFYKGLGLKL